MCNLRVCVNGDARRENLIRLDGLRQDSCCILREMCCSFFLSLTLSIRILLNSRWSEDR